MVRDLLRGSRAGASCQAVSNAETRALLPRQGQPGDPGSLRGHTTPRGHSVCQGWLSLPLPS